MIVENCLQMIYIYINKIEFKGGDGHEKKGGHSNSGKLVPFGCK